MAYTGTAPGGPVDLSDLSGLFERPGPVATVCLPTPAAVGNATRRDLQRWGDLRRDLARAGAPDGVLDDIEALIPDAHRAGQGLARLVDVAIRAAALTDARVRMVPAAGGPAEGIGALLRWGVGAFEF